MGKQENPARADTHYARARRGLREHRPQSALTVRNWQCEAGTTTQRACGLAPLISALHGFGGRGAAWPTADSNEATTGAARVKSLIKLKSQPYETKWRPPRHGSQNRKPQRSALTPHPRAGARAL